MVSVVERLSRTTGGSGKRASGLVDGASVAVFRIGFGAIVAWEVWRAFDHIQIRADYAIPSFQFRWWLFDWVRPLPDPLLYGAFALLGLAAVCVALGLRYRWATAVQFAGVTYWFLMEKAAYLNHHYLTVLFAFLLIFIPANTSWSLDGRNTRDRGVPMWTVWLLRFQVGVPYFFAGLAKLNGDWLVRNEPLRMWLSRQTDFPLIGQLLIEPGVIRAMAYASAALDLCVPFLLLHRRTRTWAFGVALIFHLMNSRLFDIGIFPWMMIVATTVFFEPEWPRRMLKTLRRATWRRNVVAVAAAIGFVVGGFLPPTFVPFQAIAGAFGVAVFAFHAVDRKQPKRSAAREPVAAMRRVTVAFLAVWVAVQLLVPLRHFVYPGNVHWTEEGQRFAWHMLLDSKRATVSFRVINDTGRRWIEPLGRHLTNYQIAKIGRSPDLILTFAHHLEDRLRAEGHGDVEVRAITTVSLNGREPQRMIDPRVDLTRIPRPYLPAASWITRLRPVR